ncbi:hypothetical protein BESB_047050 [Besnoitia besnoiti]|uniref:YGGT family protein n=1 Tax=Besnoitia besnoiti TaxID=94643 RepID=A0A2A9MLE7_BESBE|nr:hypothetical protein BESB_047050 [Besnoitia besnoiti]PFH36513.1 hypothetical protein BESB_047050 [Besnoitia besnoiti]
MAPGWCLRASDSTWENGCLRACDSGIPDKGVSEAERERVTEEEMMMSSSPGNAASSPLASLRGRCARALSRLFFPFERSAASGEPPADSAFGVLPRLLLGAVKKQATLIKDAKTLYNASRILLSRFAEAANTRLADLGLALRPVIHLLLLHHQPLFLAAAHLIRFFKILLYLRYLFDWLPQVNPHLPPFTFVYRATDAYISIFTRFVPSIASMDLSGFAAWGVLEMTENSLARLIATFE